jgi:hypothetical protein
MELNPKLNDPQMLLSVETFLKAYRNLDIPGKIACEIKIVQVIKPLDERTKNLYLALIGAAKKGFSVRESLAEMEKAG